MISFVTLGRFWRFDVKSRTDAAASWGERFVHFIQGLFSKSKKRKKRRNRHSHYNEAISPRRRRELEDE